MTENNNLSLARQLVDTAREWRACTPQQEALKAELTAELLICLSWLDNPYTGRGGTYTDLDKLGIYAIVKRVARDNAVCMNPQLAA